MVSPVLGCALIRRVSKCLCSLDYLELVSILVAMEMIQTDRHSLFQFVTPASHRDSEAQLEQDGHLERIIVVPGSAGHKSRYPVLTAVNLI